MPFSPALGPIPIGTATPGTICSPLRKLYAHRIPGLTNRSWDHSVFLSLTTFSPPSQKVSTRKFRRGLATHTVDWPRFVATTEAEEPNSLRACGSQVAPAFQCVTSRREC